VKVTGGILERTGQYSYVVHHQVREGNTPKYGPDWRDTAVICRQTAGLSGSWLPNGVKRKACMFACIIRGLCAALTNLFSGGYHFIISWQAFRL
jgi:hypothetical protein